MAERIQLSRAKGWRMPENTVKVDRTTKWGNAYIVSPLKPGKLLVGERVAVRNLADALACFETSLTGRQVAEIRAELGGKNLACWCALDKPCHADVLLRLANGRADG